MNKREAKQLKPGDEVYWNDPDEGNCSKHITIQTIEVFGDIVRITTTDGSELECFPHELT